MTPRLAFDRASVRTTDADGRLHVEITNISKANICPYAGREIPDFERLGLDPEKIYNLYRDPAELAKGAATFNNIPLLSEHVPVSVDDHQPDLVVGSTGTDAVFEAPYLKNSLVVWTADAISAIEREEQRELSCAYRYVAVMTPGSHEGLRFDGIMTNIVGNHVALVPQGRAGPDVIVGDCKNGELLMPATALNSRKATLVYGALAAHVTPLLAADAKVDLTIALDGVTTANFKAKKPVIVAAVTKMTKGKLAADATLEGLADLLTALEPVEAGAADEDDLDDDDITGMDAEGLRNFLTGKLSEDDMTQVDKLIAGPSGASDEDDDPEPKKEDDKVDKKAMDAAIQAAEARTVARMTAIAKARDDVRPYIGEVSAMDSAAAIYELAIKQTAPDLALDGVDPSAYAAILRVLPVPGSTPEVKRPLAMDATAAVDYSKRYPAASRVRHL